MRLHLLGIPHTITRDEFSHCAFTGKVQRFSPMMRSAGYHVIHYGVEGAESGANEQVTVMLREEWEELRAMSREQLNLPPTDAFVGSLANTDSALYQVFNANAAAALHDYVRDESDIICMPFGHAHGQAVAGFAKNPKVETGIGYPITCTDRRIFESYAWQSYHFGKHGEHHQDYSWVIPNYYNLDEWPSSAAHGSYALFFGRIGSAKGLDVVFEMAVRRPRVRFVICGQGDPSPWLGPPNVEYVKPLSGRDRSKLVREAAVMLAPTRFVEPFCGSVVEAALSGTPAITSDHGAFSETVEDERTGFRCKTLGDYLAALDRALDGELDRVYTAMRARAKYDMYKLANDYDRVFKQIDDLRELGWYSSRSHLRRTPRRAA